jgi:hypothetical protein
MCYGMRTNFEASGSNSVLSPLVFALPLNRFHLFGCRLQE